MKGVCVSLENQKYFLTSGRKQSLHLYYFPNSHQAVSRFERTRVYLAFYYFIDIYLLYERWKKQLKISMCFISKKMISTIMILSFLLSFNNAVCATPKAQS